MSEVVLTKTNYDIYNPRRQTSECRAEWLAACISVAFASKVVRRYLSELGHDLSYYSCAHPSLVPNFISMATSRPKLTPRGTPGCKWQLTIRCRIYEPKYLGCVQNVGCVQNALSTRAAVERRFTATECLCCRLRGIGFLAGACDIGEPVRRKLARLGGYLARAGDGPPGNTVMWRGLSRLTDIEIGYILGAQNSGN